jgi:pyruvate dehydrogenase E1 component
MRTKGFMMGGTAGRTTINGEGLQHEDGHSHLLASCYPTVRAYDPAFAYEMAVIIQDGIKWMYEDRNHGFYYLTIYNENYPQPKMPEGAEDGIRRGMYLFRESELKDAEKKVTLFGSGPIMRDVLRAAEMLEETYKIAADVFSVTSYNELRRDCLEVERWNLLHPTDEPKKSYLQQQLEGRDGPFIASSDYMKAVPDQVTKWVPGGLVTLGTDGFGRSESRPALRRHFEVDAEHVVIASLDALAERGQTDKEEVAKAIKEFGLDPEKIDPMYA